MFLIRDGHAAILVLVLALTQCSVFASLDNARNETQDRAELIDRYLKLPWMDGIEWLAHSSGSPEAKEFNTFIRAVLAGELWATQILDTTWEKVAYREKGSVQYVRKNYGKISDGCEGKNADDNDNDDGYCVASGVPAGSEHSQSFVSSASEKSKDFSVTEMSTIVVFSVLGMVLLGCTMCDFVKRNSSEKSSTTIDTLSKFSLYKNALAVFNTKYDGDMMPAIQGLRCLGFFTIMHAHRFVLYSVLLNKQFLILDLVKVKNTLFGLSLEMSVHAVDTFTVISGFLQAYMFFKIKRSGFEFNVFTMYLHRYLRLTPCIVVLIIISVAFSGRFQSGPTWETMANPVDPCRENWWINLFYFQNFVPAERMCLAHTWYLALDMQLFWLSPLILYPLYNSPKFGMRVLISSLLVAVFTPAVVLAVGGYWNSLLRLDVDFRKQLENVTAFYVLTYNRAFPYLVGILLGYDVATRKRHLTKTNVAINWMVTGLLILFCTWLNNLVYTAGYVGDRHLEIPAILVLRPFWSIAVAWIVYACTQGYGGFVTKFLSLPIFLPLSRLSYCIYLVHIGVQAMTIPSFNESMKDSSISYMVNGFFGDVVLSTAVAFVLSLFIERPTIVLTKILLDRRGRKPTIVTPVRESNNQSNSEMEKDSISKSC